MPHGIGADAALSHWRVLVVGPEGDAPLLVSILQAIDRRVIIDRATTANIAEQRLLTPVRYDVVFVLTSFGFAPDERVEDLLAQLSVGERPPPLVAVNGLSLNEDREHQLDSLIPVSIHVSLLESRRLLGSIRTARDLQRQTRLNQLIAAAPERLSTDDGQLVGLHPLLDELIAVLDVDGVELSLASRDAELSWESAAGVKLAIGGPDAGHGRTVSPIFALSRLTPGFTAQLRIGPLSPHSQARHREQLESLLGLILSHVQQVSDQRSVERAALMQQLLSGSIVTTPPTDQQQRASWPDMGSGIEALADALPDFPRDLILALVHQDLTILHQPIANASGAIEASDMLLGLSSAPPVPLHEAQRVPDLSVLDSLDTASEPLVTQRLTVPTGHWLVATALTAFHRLLESGDLERTHRVHLALLHRQLADRGTVDLLIDLVQAHGFQPHTVAIDVAEPTLTEHHDTISALSRLAGHGIDLYLDGFGGAGSNFTLLRTPLVRGVKLSKEVIRGVSLDSRQASIVYGLISLCDELGLEVIATGVDHHADFDWLTEFAHISLQGNLIGPVFAESDLLGQRIAGTGPIR